MLSTDDLEDELAPSPPDEETVGDTHASKYDEGLVPKLVPGSVTARVLYQAWSGSPVTIVDSPPGAGKSTLITTVVSHLRAGTDLAIVIATPTRRQAIDIALRIEKVTAPETVFLDFKSFKDSEVSDYGMLALNRLKSPRFPRSGKDTVVVNTLASIRRRRMDLDVLFIDEAYQATYADVLASAAKAKQVVLVGDPGQIGPVITVDTSAWDHLDYNPAARGPEVFARRGDAFVLNLPGTYRLGAETAAAIAPLYGFEFDSKRPHREIDGLREVESIVMNAANGAHDVSLLSEVAGVATKIVGRDLIGDGFERRQIEPSDVAIVVPHNVQVSILKGALESMGMPGITVGTADKLQGGEWEAVVVLDPLFGVSAIDNHSASLGRLCVMCSRHRSHLTFIHDNEWNELLAADENMAAGESDKAIAVRKSVTHG